MATQTFGEYFRKMYVMSTPRINAWIAPTLVAVVIVHLAIALWHGMAHSKLQIDLTALQAVFVGIVISLLPLVGTGMLWTRWKKGGAWLVALSMFASLVFGVVNHFVLESSDNVMSLPDHPWSHPFALSADLLAVTELIGFVVAAAAIWKGRRENEN